MRELVVYETCLQDNTHKYAVVAVSFFMTGLDVGCDVFIGLLQSDNPQKIHERFTRDVTICGSTLMGGWGQRNLDILDSYEGPIQCENYRWQKLTSKVVTGLDKETVLDAINDLTEREVKKIADYWLTQEFVWDTFQKDKRDTAVRKYEKTNAKKARELFGLDVA